MTFDDKPMPTSFDIAVQETDKTDKTEYYGNQAFLQTVFGVGLSDHLPVVVSFAGDPSKVSKNAWYGAPWKNGDAATPINQNNYFSLAVFRPDEAGKFRRKKKQFVALHAIMLDDVGTKVPLERLTLPPSWQIETSTGNFQVGYILAEPIADSAIADRLMNAIVNAGLCDPGANGPTARLARLPEGINEKYEPQFDCRMPVFDPTRRYSLDELISGLELEFHTVGEKQSGKKVKSQPDNDHHEIVIPRPTENIVIGALRLRNLYKMPLGGGKHDITCPWVAEHTGGVDGGTAYFEPTDHWPIGGFKCLHGHCTNRHMRDLLDYIGVEMNAARMKPTIRVIPGEIHRVVDAAEKELSSTGKHYQRGGLIVTITTDPGTLETKILESNQPSLVQALAGAANWERFDNRSDEYVRIDPPARHVGVLYDATDYNHLPILAGLARQPYFRPDGTLVTTPGFDPATGMFGIFPEREFSVPEYPTMEQAQAALAKLQDILTEFAFATDVDKSAALSAILTAAARPSLPTAPMVHVKAHQVGSGKSYLCKVITIFATPQHGTPSTFPKDDEECRKLLLAELLRGPAVIEFDNLTGDLIPHKTLCIALTSEFITDRILGVSKTATVSTRALFLSSGNNVGPVNDMTRRCITIHLDPACEMPATRTFQRPDLLRELQRERGAYISAALTIIRAWIVAGKPKTPCPSLAGYDQWSDFCRQPLLWLGCTDPVQSVFEAMADDPDRETLGQLLRAWQACFGKRPTMVREAVTISDISGERAELYEILKDIAGEKNEINRRMLGRWIKRNSGRIVNGLRFVRASGSRSAEAWYVESVS